jgi:hypothetical protein
VETSYGDDEGDRHYALALKCNDRRPTDAGVEVVRDRRSSVVQVFTFVVDSSPIRRELTALDDRRPPPAGRASRASSCARAELGW